MPVSKSTLWVHPRVFKREISSSFLGVPSGFVASCIISPLKSTIFFYHPGQMSYLDFYSRPNIDELADVHVIKALH